MESRSLACIHGQSINGDARFTGSLAARCLKKLGEDTSTIKDTAIQMTAGVQGMLHAMSSDEVLKHALASNAFEHFEAASYCSLMAAGPGRWRTRDRRDV